MSNNMLKFSLVHSLSFLWLGKFVSPSENWQHMSRRLTEYEIMIVDSGVLYIGNENESYQVKAGEYLIMRPCLNQHGYRSSACSFHWLHFLYNEAFNNIEGDYLMIPQHGKYEDLARLEKILGEIYFVWQNYSDRHYASYLVTTLILELKNQSGGYDNTRQSGKRKLKQSVISKKVKDYIRFNCNITTKVSGLAEELGYSEKYISAVFKKETGMTIRQYLSEQIVEQAKQSLLNSNYSISQIAYSYGFSDAQNFSRTFKRVSGLSPKDFRNEFTTVYH